MKIIYQLKKPTHAESYGESAVHCWTSTIKTLEYVKFFKINNKNTRTIGSKLTVKLQEQYVLLVQSQE